MQTSQVFTCYRQQTLSHTKELVDDAHTPSVHLLQTLYQKKGVADNADKPSALSHMKGEADISVTCSPVADTVSR